MTIGAIERSDSNNQLENSVEEVPENNSNSSDEFAGILSAQQEEQKVEAPPVPDQSLVYRQLLHERSLEIEKLREQLTDSAVR